jgi:hypothetical protein
MLSRCQFPAKLLPKSSLVGPHSATTCEAHYVYSVDMQRESRLSAVRKRRDRALSTLLACRQSSTALRVSLVNDAEDEDQESRKLLTRRSRLMMRSFNLQEWSQDGSVRKFRFRSADISQITKLLTWPVECMMVDSRVRTPRKCYIFDPEEGAVYRLGTPEHSWAMARN